LAKNKQVKGYCVQGCVGRRNAAELQDIELTAEISSSALDPREYNHPVQSRGLIIGSYDCCGEVSGAEYQKGL